MGTHHDKKFNRHVCTGELRPGHAVIGEASRRSRFAALSCIQTACQANQAYYGLDANAGDTLESTCSWSALANEHHLTTPRWTLQPAQHPPMTLHASLAPAPLSLTSPPWSAKTVGRHGVWMLGKQETLQPVRYGVWPGMTKRVRSPQEVEE